MTYREIKDRLSKCEYTLKCIKDGTLKEKDDKTVENLELLKESLQKQLIKEEEKGMVVTKDSEEAEKLAKKGVNVKLTTEAPGDYHYVKVARRDYKKAIGIIMKELGGDYVELNDPDTIYFKNLDQATLADAVMDLQANDIDILDTSIDVFGEATDINDPVLMKLRALKSKIGKKKGNKTMSSKHSAILSKLQTKRDQVMRDMEQEAEPEGGPIADKYGDMLNKIDAAIAKAKGLKEDEYDDMVASDNDIPDEKKKAAAKALRMVDKGASYDKVKKYLKEGQDEVFALGYDLDAIQYVIDYLKSKYKEGQDYELHIGRGDTHPNAITLKNPAMEQDEELGNLLMNAGDNEETDYQADRETYKDYVEEKLDKQHLSILASKAGKAVVKAVHDSGDEVARAKIKDVYASPLSGDSSPEAFTVHIIYKNDSEVSYRFQIINSALYLLADNEDIKISDIGFKPSGEPFINTELVRNEMTKYFKQMREMTDQEFADAKEADRLANHPEKDKILAIQQLIAKEKGIKEVDIDEYSSGPWTKHKLLAYLGQADDAMIRTHDDKYLIIYNPKNGNDDNAKMWNDDSVFGVDQDGQEHEVSYDNIDGLQLEDTNESRYTKLRDYYRKIDKLKQQSKIDHEKNPGHGNVVDKEKEIKENSEFETADEWADDGRYYVKVEDNGKGGEWIIDPNQSKYTPGTKLILNTLDEQEYRFEDAEDYFLQVQRMEALKNEAEAEHLINRYGTDLVDELELHKEWHDVMFPEDIEDDDDDEDEEFYESADLDKVIKAKKLIKQQASAMNKLPQDDPKRRAFIDNVKQINQKYKELLAKQDKKISDTGRNQELDEYRGSGDEIKAIIRDRAADSGFSEQEEAEEVMEFIGQEYEIDFEFGAGPSRQMEEESDLYEVKVGDTLTKDGKKGKVTKISDTQATVDFGNGDVYGIAHSRIKGKEILKEGTDLHVDKDFQFTRTSSGIQITEKYSGYGPNSRYIHVPGRLLKRFIAGLAKSSKVFKDIKYQGQDAENPLQENK